MTTTATDRSAGNDVRGVLLAHDRLRAGVPPVAGDVRALRPGDRRGLRELVQRWERLSRTARRQLDAESAVLWPAVLATAPELAGEVRRLEQEHAALLADLALVGLGLARLGAPDAATVRINLAAVVLRLDIHLRRHLAGVEQLALPVLRHRTAPDAWPALSAALSGGDGAPERRAGLRAPLRVLHRVVHGPAVRPSLTRSGRAPGR